MKIRKRSMCTNGTKGTQEQGQLSTFEVTLLIVQAHGCGVKWACNVMGVAGQHSHFSDDFLFQLLVSTHLLHMMMMVEQRCALTSGRLGLKSSASSLLAPPLAYPLLSIRRKEGDVTSISTPDTECADGAS